MHACRDAGATRTLHLKAGKQAISRTDSDRARFVAPAPSTDDTVHALDMDPRRAQHSVAMPSDAAAIYGKETACLPGADCHDVTNQQAVYTQMLQCCEIGNATELSRLINTRRLCLGCLDRQVPSPPHPPRPRPQLSLSLVVAVQSRNQQHVLPKHRRQVRPFRRGASAHMGRSAPRPQVVLCCPRALARPTSATHRAPDACDQAQPRCSMPPI